MSRNDERVENGRGLGVRLSFSYHCPLQLKLKRYYEKPTKKRERLEYEKCYRIYNREMKKKIAFVMKQHDPLPPV